MKRGIDSRFLLVILLIIGAIVISFYLNPSYTGKQITSTRIGSSTPISPFQCSTNNDCDYPNRACVGGRCTDCTDNTQCNLGDACAMPGYINGDAGDCVTASCEHLASYWPFDEGQGTQACDSLALNNCIDVSTTDWVSGIDGAPAVFLDGNDYFKLYPDISDGDDEGTIEFVIRPQNGAWDNDAYVLNYYIDADNWIYVRYKKSNNEFQLHVKESGTSYKLVKSPPPQIGVFAHIVVTWTTLTGSPPKKKFNFFWNAVQLGTNIKPLTNPYKDRFEIGTDQNHANGFKGQIDEFAAFDVALTQAEIQEHYQNLIIYPHNKYCATNICGNGVCEWNENTCSCAQDCGTYCGDGCINSVNEQCDGADDGACPGLCLSNCVCPILPDLIIPSVSVTQVSIPGGMNITVHVTIKNIGSAPITWSNPMYVQVQYSGAITGQVILYLSSLQPGQSAIISGTIPTLFPVGSGFYNGIAIADYMNTIQELLETNNDYPFTFIV